MNNVTRRLNLERDVVSQNLWAAWTWQPAVSQRPQRSNVHRQVELKIGVCWNTSCRACMKCSKEPGVVNSQCFDNLCPRYSYNLSQTLLLTTEPLVTWQWVEQRIDYHRHCSIPRLDPKALTQHSETWQQPCNLTLFSFSIWKQELSNTRFSHACSINSGGSRGGFILL